MKEIVKHYRMDRRQIALFRFLLEAYDGLAVLRTIAPAEGRVALHLSVSREAELDEMIRGVAGDIRLEPADADETQTVRQHTVS